MANYQIPITYVVNASVIPASRGLEPLKLSTILLMTDDEVVNPLDTDYIIARNSKAVGQAFGTETDTAKMAQAIFAQNPNILNNDGYVIVAPYLDDVVITPATAGTFTTIDLTDKLAAIKLVANGDLTIVVDSENVGLSDIDCTGINTVEELATLLNGKTSECNITANGNFLVFTSTTTGTSSTVSLIATADGEGTDLYGTSYLDGANGVAVAGQAEVRGKETLAQAIARLAEQIYFEAILTPRDLTSIEATNASALVQSMGDRLLFLIGTSTSDLSDGGLFRTLQSNNYTRKLLYLTGDTTEARNLNGKLFAAAYASRGLAVNYNGSNTTLTMNLKDLANVPIDTNISETILAQCEALGVDVYCSLEGLGKVISFAQGGEYFDQVTNRIWLLNTIQRAVFNVLATTRTKIPQTEQGMAMLESACRQVCVQGVINGMLAPGAWNSSDTFGNLEDFHRNIEEFGYYIYHLPVAEQAQSEREERKAPAVQIACKEAGAIHSANIQIYIEA